MIRFDSKSLSMSLVKTMAVDGERVSTEPVSLDLSGLDERTRQLLIRMSKICINFANGQNIDQMSQDFNTAAQHVKEASAKTTSESEDSTEQ